MLVVRKHPLIFDSLKKMLCNSFDMMDLGEAQSIWKWNYLKREEEKKKVMAIARAIHWEDTIEAQHEEL